MKLLVSTTPVSLWRDIIQEAQGRCEINLSDELEAYLVFLLMRYINQPEIAKQVMATPFLQAHDEQKSSLQAVGDKCLLFSGLFPAIAQKRLIKISYFVNMGKIAYFTISLKKNDLYASLCKQFVPIMDVLQSIRQYAKDTPDLLPLEAYDLWNETGSQRALSALKLYTPSMPIHCINESEDNLDSARIYRKDTNR